MNAARTGKKLVFCSIGAGSLSRSAHGPALKALAAERDDLVLAAVAGLDRPAVEEYADDFGYRKAYTEYHEMIDQEKPDAVSVIVPVEHTCAVACDVLARGIPVIMEKPPGKDAGETERIIETARMHGVKNMVAFNRRHMPIIRRMKDILSAAMPEDIHFIRLDFYRHARADADFSTTAIHGIDTVRVLARSGIAQCALDYRPTGVTAGVDDIFVHGTFDSGARFSMAFLPMAGTTIERITVSLKDATYIAQLPVWNGTDAPGSIVRLGKRAEMVWSGDDGSESTEMFRSNGFYHEHRAFIEALVENRSIEDDAASVLESVVLADRIRCRARAYSRDKLQR